MTWRIGILGILSAAALTGLYLSVPIIRYYLIPVTGGVLLPAGFLENQPSGAILNGVHENGDWLNTEPLDLNTLLADKKVVLVDFWTYSCINCVRATPHLQALYNRYKDYGLVVIGVHSPEFSFERSPQNITRAIARAGITYPVFTDADRIAWQQIGNHAWPGRYLIIPGRRVIFTHFGEGAYEEEHRVVRAALEKLGHTVPPYEPLPNNLTPSPVMTTPELYAGLAFLRRPLGNAERLREGVMTKMVLPEYRTADTLYLEGSWIGQKEFVESTGDGRILLTYTAQSVYFVLESVGNLPRDIIVRYDGEAVAQAVRGEDTHAQSVMQIYEPRMYIPIAHHAPYGVHTIELIVPAGVRLYSVTFGSYNVVVTTYE